MLIIITPDQATLLMHGPNAEWFQFDNNEWTLVNLTFDNLINKHTKIMDWIAREIVSDVYGALYDGDIFPAQDEIDKKLAEIDAWIKKGNKTFSKNSREKQRAQKEHDAQLPTRDGVGYVFCFTTEKDALKFKMVWG